MNAFAPPTRLDNSAPWLYPPYFEANRLNVTSEAVGQRVGSFLSTFPQAFSHIDLGVIIGVINSAINLVRGKREHDA